MSGDEIVTVTVRSADGKKQVSTSYSLMQADLYKGGRNDYHISALDLAFVRLEEQISPKKDRPQFPDNRFLEEASISDAFAYSTDLIKPKCGCRACNPTAWWMVVCDLCGNKRCPRGSHHVNPCTSSNEPG